jgi:hypothetical protein
MRISTRSFFGGLLTLGALSLATGCSDDSPTEVQNDNPPPNMASDFLLADMNVISPTFAHTISPRDYLGSLSAWYFGHST